MVTIKNKLVIFDSHWFIMRTLHGYANGSRDTPLIEGFIQMVGKVLTRLNPTHVLFIFDSDNGNSWRKDIYPLYKAQRGEKDKSLIAEIDYVIDILKKMNIYVLQLDDVEADDLIHSVTLKYKENFHELIIASRDKDLMGLVDDENSVYLYDDNKNVYFDEQKVIDTYGVYPNQIVDYLSLMGDSVDNIPGCEKIGKKGAAKLIAEGAFKEKLTSEQLADFKLSKKLVKLKKYDVDIDLAKLNVNNICLKILNKQHIAKHTYFLKFDN